MKNDSGLRQDALKHKWKVMPCNVYDCWCALIGYSEKKLEDYWVVPTGNLTIREAKHIVKLHNKWLRGKKK
jgi:hypothetical protein